MATYPVVKGRIEYDSDSMEVIGANYPNSAQFIPFNSTSGAAIPGAAEIPVYYQRAGKWIFISFSSFVIDATQIPGLTASIGLRSVAGNADLCPIGGPIHCGCTQVDVTPIVSGTQLAGVRAAAETNAVAPWIRLMFSQLLTGVGDSILPGVASGATSITIHDFTGCYPVRA